MPMPRTEEWGDEQVERDAAAAVAESAADGRDGRGEEARTLWYFIRRSGKRIAVALGGFGLIILGLILVPLPGPGWAIVFAGIALLATEFVWAERLLGFAKRMAGKGMDIAFGPAEERSWPAIIAMFAAIMGPVVAIASAIVHPGTSVELMAAWISAGLSIFAIVLGHVALFQIKRAPHEAVHGHWLAIGALLLGYPSAVLLIGLLLPTLRA